MKNLKKKINYLLEKHNLVDYAEDFNGGRGMNKSYCLDVNEFVQVVNPKKEDIATILLPKRCLYCGCRYLPFMEESPGIYVSRHPQGKTINLTTMECKC